MLLDEPMNEIEKNIDGIMPMPQAAMLPARAISALVDYMVLFTLSSLLGHFRFGFDYEFLLPLIVGAFYFSIGNSHITSGQTLGKKAFGLRVVTLGNTASNYLSISRSFIRYMMLYGILIVVAEIPKVIYRQNAISASTIVLELNMLLALAYFFSNIGFLVFLTNHLGFHDLTCKTMVTRKLDENELPPKVSEPYLSMKNASIGASIGAIFSLVVWFFSLPTDASIALIAQRKFVIENKLPIRIVHVERDQLNLAIYCFSIAQASEIDDIEKNSQRLAVELVVLLKDTLSTTNDFSQVVITIHSEAINSEGSSNTTIKHKIVVDPKSLQIENFEQADAREQSFAP